MLMFSAHDLKKTFAGETLFEDVSFTLYGADKVGFVGVNGAGKSTLFKMMIGDMEHDGGELTKSRETRIGYLEQYAVSDGDRTILQEMLTAFSQVVEIEKQLDELRLAIENADGDPDALVARQAALQEQFIAHGGAYYRSRIKSALLGLGFSQADFSLPLRTLSGGQKTRIALCKILLSDANLLLLDEPTNHLDMDSIEWLEEFLIGYKGAFVVVSHDRYFLDRVTQKTFALENKRLYTYNGNYSAYIAQREIEKLTETRNYDRTMQEIHRLEEVIEQQRRWKHKKNKKTHTMDNTRKAIERLEDTLVVPDKAPETMHFRFRACAGGAQRVLETEDLGMTFGEKALFAHVDMPIRKGEKVFLLGPNGCGKTTLLKILMGLYAQSSGTYRIGENVQVGYYDQLKENLHRDKTVIDEIWDAHPDLTQTEIRSALAVFLFKGEDVFKPICALSGGELARVELTKLLLDSVNFLIMDEPTNHLDVAAREALEAALSGYDGTMLMVSHDRYFIDKLSDRIVYLTADGVVNYEGNYTAFRAAKRAQTAPEPTKKATEKGAEYKERKRLEAENRKTRSRFAKIEAQIEQTENEIKTLTQLSESEAVASDYVRLGELLAQIDTLRDALDGYMQQWEVLQQAVDALDAQAGM